MARRSAIEIAAWMEIIQRREQGPQQLLTAAFTNLQPIVAMLVRLIRSRGDETAGTGTGKGTRASARGRGAGCFSAAR